MLFPKRQDVVTNFTGTVAASSKISFELTRDFFLDSLILKVPITIAGSTGATVFTPYGLWQAIQNIRLKIADGSSNRSQTDASGRALLQRAAKILSGLDINTLKCTGAHLNNLIAAGGTFAQGTYILSVPLLFKHPQISDPIGSATMLPLPRYNTNPTLEVSFGPASDIVSTAGGATLTFGTPYVLVNRRQVDNIMFPTLETEFIETIFPQAATGSNILVELQVPGSYTGIGLTTFNGAGAALDIAGGPWQLQFLGNVIRRFNFADLQTEEQYSQGNDLYISDEFDPVLPGFGYMDFLHDGFGMEVGELGSVMNTNLLAGSGSRLQLLLNLASTGQLSISAERIFGDLSPYTFQLGTPAG